MRVDHSRKSVARGLLAGLLLALGSVALAQEPRVAVPPPPLFPRALNAVKAPHQPTPVPPTLEIEVLDPNVDPRGNPAVVTKPSCVRTCHGPEGRLTVDIPEVVLVHRYYYTGDRTFQGPFLPGGP